MQDWRKSEIEWAFQRIAEREHVWVYGEWGSGKRSLLSALSQRLKGRRLCVHLDGTNWRTTGAFCREMLQSLRQLGREQGSLQLHLKRFLEFNPEPTFEKAEEEDLLQWTSHLVLSLEQTGLDFCFLYQNLEKLPLLRESNNWLKLNAARNVQSVVAALKPLPKAGFELCHLEPIGADHPNLGASEYAQEALKLSCGNVQFLDALMRMETSFPSANRALEAFLLERENLFLAIQERFTAAQWKLLSAIAREEVVKQPHAFDFLVKYMLGAASTVERALGSLLKSHFLIQGKDGYRLADVQLMRWLQLHPHY